MVESKTARKLFQLYSPSYRIIKHPLLLGLVAGFFLLENLGSQSVQAQNTEIVPYNSEFETNSAESLLKVSPIEESDNKSIPTSTSDQVNQIPEKIVVDSFEVTGSSVFTLQELNQILGKYEHRPLSLAELFQARSAITKLYTEKGYVNSGAYIPPQELDNGTVQIAILEGKLEDIQIKGTRHLNPDYIRSRIERYAATPVNVESLLEALQMLRLDPLIKNVSAELSAGINPGTSLLEVEIEEADSFFINTKFDNQRSPSVGTNRRGIGLQHSNLLGFGDKISLNYTNTEGSDSLDFTYALPVNAKNGSLRIAYGTSSNDVIEAPFTPLDIQSESEYYELDFRQPLMNSPNQEFALGLTFSHQASKTTLLDTPFALSRGADEAGRTKISALRFYQEYVARNDREVFALRSQFSAGLDVFDATINENAPDSVFFAWRGQSQWVRRLDEDFLLVLRGDMQFATTELVPLEQFRVGGVNSVRGYRQDLVLGDNGLFTSAELRIPLLKLRQLDGVLQLTPFVDLGTVWNRNDLEINTDFIAAVGLGLNFNAGNNFSARIDWGIPLVEVETQGNSLQENGIHFSVDFAF